MLSSFKGKAPEKDHNAAGTGPPSFLAAGASVTKPQDDIAPLLISRPVRSRDTDHLANDLHGERTGEVGNQIHFAPLDVVIQKLAR